VDGYDVVQRRTDLTNFELKFKNTGADLIFSAETYCWPNPWNAYHFPPAPPGCQYRFPNSGTFVGYAWAIKKMLHWDTYRLTFDDQGYIHDFFLKCKDLKIGLDNGQVLFQTGTGIRWSVLDTCQAWFVHFNGRSHWKKDGSSVLDEYFKCVPIGGMQQWHTVP
jgi:procollagen-lysine,2-oxoglutarate 5-dioxygenase